MTNRKGELATTLTIISGLLILAGLIVGVTVVKNQVNNSSAAQNNFKVTSSGCPSGLGNWSPSQLTNNIAPIGPKIAGNIDPSNYQQIRSLYNCRNSGFQSQWIPVTVVYALDTINENQQAMTDNLNAMKGNGLYPIVRIASYTNGNGQWIPIGPPDDAKIGTNLAGALKSVSFPTSQPPIVYFGNEVNLPAEWGGTPNGAGYADALFNFVKAMDSTGTQGTNFLIYFPPLSYGLAQFPPAAFLTSVATELKAKGGITLDGGAFTIYGAPTDIQNQYNLAKNDLTNALGPTFLPSTAKFVVTELGPTPAQNDSPTEQQNWITRVTPIYNNYLSNPSSLGNIVTTAFFDPQNLEHLVVVFPPGSNPAAELDCINSYAGQAPPDCAASQGPTPPGGGTPLPTAPPANSGGQLNFSPSAPSAGGNVAIGFSSDTAFTWVYLQGRDPAGSTVNFPRNNPNIPQVCVAPAACNRNASLNPSSRKYLWIYTLNNLIAGTYNFNFYSDCNTGCRPQGPTTPLTVGGTGAAATNTPPPGQATATPTIAANASPTVSNNLTPTSTPIPSANGPGPQGYTNKDYENVILQYGAEQISPLTVSQWLSQATRVPGLQKAICYPPNCEFVQ